MNVENDVAELSSVVIIGVFDKPLRLSQPVERFQQIDAGRVVKLGVEGNRHDKVFTDGRIQPFFRRIVGVLPGRALKHQHIPNLIRSGGIVNRTGQEERFQHFGTAEKQIGVRLAAFQSNALINGFSADNRHGVVSQNDLFVVPTQGQF